MMASFHLAILGALLLASPLFAYPGGAPKKACTGSMLPHHHHLAPQPLSSSPITKFASTWNPDGETVSVQIEAKQPIKGIFIQGRKVNGVEPLGSFVNHPAGTHIVSCPTGDGLTHSSPQKWTHLTVTWKKPSSVTANENIQFWATIVVDFEHFWVVKSV